MVLALLLCKMEVMFANSILKWPWTDLNLWRNAWWTSGLIPDQGREAKGPKVSSLLLVREASLEIRARSGALSPSRAAKLRVKFV